MTQLLSIIGTFWLVAAFWVDSGGAEEVLWASILPSVWLVSLTLLRN